MFPFSPVLSETFNYFLRIFIHFSSLSTTDEIGTETSCTRVFHLIIREKIMQQLELGAAVGMWACARRCIESTRGGVTFEGVELCHLLLCGRAKAQIKQKTQQKHKIQQNKNNC